MAEAGIQNTKSPLLPLSRRSPSQQFPNEEAAASVSVFLLGTWRLSPFHYFLSLDKDSNKLEINFRQHQPTDRSSFSQKQIRLESQNRRTQHSNQREKLKISNHLFHLAKSQPKVWRWKQQQNLQNFGRLCHLISQRAQLGRQLLKKVQLMLPSCHQRWRGWRCRRRRWNLSSSWAAASKQAVSSLNQMSQRKSPPSFIPRKSIQKNLHQRPQSHQSFTSRKFPQLKCQSLQTKALKRSKQLKPLWRYSM